MLAQCWNAPFLTLDDVTYIAHDPRLREDAAWAETLQHRSGYPFYYPATLLSWRIDRAVWSTVLEPVAGKNAWAAGVRTTNLLLHLGAALFVWLILRRLGAGAALAGFSTAAFALHPVACETVCWAVERKNALAACLGLAALWRYMSARALWHHTLAALLFALALLSKPSALGIFAIVAAWEALGRPALSNSSPAPQEPFAKRWRSVALRLLPWVVLAGAGTALGFVMHAENLLKPPGGTAWTALLTDVEILWRYARNFFWPAGLSAYYCVQPIVSLADPRLWGFGALLAALVAGTIFAARAEARCLSLFAWLWFLGALGTNLNLVGINDLMHDRFVYLSAPGFWLAIGLALEGAATRLALRERLPDSASAICIGSLALVLGAASFTRGGNFSLAAKLFEEAVAKEPGSSYARIFLAADYKTLANHKLKKGESQEAERIFALSFESLKAGVHAPDFDRFLHRARAHADLAVAFQQRGAAEEAVEQARNSLAADRDPDAWADAHQILGLAALKRNDLNAALSEFDAAIRLAPQVHSIHMNRARTLLLFYSFWKTEGDETKARAALMEAARSLRVIVPADEAYGDAQSLLHLPELQGVTSP
ncbi:MAG: hypothetical protein HY291_03955 [Planctomycetes bacterium]|nr:hypothetical protein [Planctomycetota bacterium]